MRQRQPDLFSTATSNRDAAISTVLANNEKWSSQALRLIQDAVTGEFTGEELRIKLLLLGLKPPKHHNAWGAIVSAAMKKRLISKTGVMKNMKTPKSHARMTPVLRRDL